MKSKLALWGCMSVFISACVGLSNLNDPSRTIDIIGFSSAPQITSVVIDLDHFDLTVNSTIEQIDDLLGYHIYITNVSNVIEEAVRQNDLNQNPSPDLLLTNTILLDRSRDVNNRNQTQEKIITDLRVDDPDTVYYLTVTAVGSNEFYGSLQDPAIIGYIESEPSRAVSFQLRRTNSFSLINQLAGSGTSGLEHSGTTIRATTGTEGDFYLMLRIDRGAVYPFFIGNNPIAGLGYVSNFSVLSTLPPRSSSLYYRGSDNPLPVILGHGYAVYDGALRYYKVWVTSVGSSPTRTSDSFMIQVDVAYVTNQNSRSF